jgi:hypothetical protein
MSIDGHSLHSNLSDLHYHRCYQKVIELNVASDK